MRSRACVCVRVCVSECVFSASPKKDYTDSARRGAIGSSVYTALVPKGLKLLDQLAVLQRAVCSGIPISALCFEPQRLVT